MSMSGANARIASCVTAMETLGDVGVEGAAVRDLRRRTGR
jgi:hypothetical protein